MPTVSSVHIPSLMKVPVVNWGKKKKHFSEAIQEYANKHKCSFVKAYRELAPNIHKSNLGEFIYG